MMVRAAPESRAMFAFAGIPNKTQVGDMDIDGRIFPVAAAPTKAATPKGQTPASTSAGDPP